MGGLCKFLSSAQRPTFPRQISGTFSISFPGFLTSFAFSAGPSILSASFTAALLPVPKCYIATKISG